MAGDIQITGKTIGKANTVIQALNKSLAYSIFDFRNAVNTFINEANPANANVFIEEWENMVGIPDGIFIVEDTLEKRVQNVLFKITSGIEPTTAGFKKLASIFGVEIEIQDWERMHILPIVLEYPLIKEELRPYVIYIRILRTTESDYENANIPHISPFILRKSQATTFQSAIRMIIPATHDVVFLN